MGSPMGKLAKYMNWNLLHTFVVIAEQQSVSRAAEVLGRGQPAISAALKKLEDQLGAKLAARGPTSFTLTDAGKLLYREAREISGSIDRLSTLISDLSGELAGTVRLSIASHMTSPLINDAFTEFHRRFPKATFDTTVMNGPDIMNAMASSMIYFGICPVFRQREEFDYFHIFKEYCGFYCGKSHPLYGRKNLTFADLAGQRAVTYRTAVFTNALQSITDLHSQAKFADPLVGVSSHMEEIRRMIIAGLGIGAIPIHIAERDVRDGLMWRVPPYELTMPIDVYLVTNPRVRPTQTEQGFIDVLKEVVMAKSLEERTYPEGLRLA
jgi:DNA-binding transcriptional LysR family regulator